MKKLILIVVDDKMGHNLQFSLLFLFDFVFLHFFSVSSFVLYTFMSELSVGQSNNLPLRHYEQMSSTSYYYYLFAQLKLTRIT